MIPVIPYQYIVMLPIPRTLLAPLYLYLSAKVIANFQIQSVSPPPGHRGGGGPPTLGRPRVQLGDCVLTTS